MTIYIHKIDQFIFNSGLKAKRYRDQLVIGIDDAYLNEAISALLAHKTSHEDGGDDEISVAGLSGLLADDQHVLDAEVLAVAAPLVHATRHQPGGGDELVGMVPSGAILAFGGASAPTGFLMCDGTSYLRSSYAALFAIIGVAFGSADGTHFNVPDLRQRFPIGKAASGTGSTLGGVGGGIDHVHSGAAHTHTGPNHRHINGGAVGGEGLAIQDMGAYTDYQAGTTGAASAANTGTGNPPFQAVNYIIRY